MAKSVIICLAVLTLSSALNAVPVNVVYSVRVDGAQKYAYIDPLTDELGQHSGFIFADSANDRLIIDDFYADSAVHINLPYMPVKVIHYYSADRDTLVIYTLVKVPPEYSPRILLHRVFSGQIDERLILPYLYYPYSYGSGNIVTMDIAIERSNGDSPSGLWFETEIRWDCYEMTMGPSVEVMSTTILYKPDLSGEIVKKSVGSMRTGDLTGDGIDDTGTFNNYYRWYDYSEPDYPNSGTTKYTDVEVLGLAAQMTNGVYPGARKLFVQDFSGASPYEELIYFGYTYDLLGIMPDLIYHVACYSFADGIADEVWYTPIITDAVNFDYVYTPWHTLAGRMGNNRALFLDYRTGRLMDTTDLGRAVLAPAYFEAGIDVPLLHLAGRSFDTVLVYQFDVATSVYTPPAYNALVPQTFTLYQNSPNPFNGETHIRFDNEVSQELSLKIYNILGQEIKALALGTHGAGSYYVSWDGTNHNGIPQSTGVYFARLQSAETSQIIKLIYLK